MYKEAVEHFLKVFDVHPEVFISDMHPNYFTTSLTDKLAEGNPRIKVQHHHAHIVAVMAEHEIEQLLDFLLMEQVLVQIAKSGEANF